MAVITDDCLVRAVKRESRCQIVVECRQRPRLARVAIAAISAAMAVVAIVFEMTAGAGHIHDVIERVLGVAVSAEQGRVFAFKREVRVAGMVEARVIPGARVVAGLALFATASVM